MDKFLRDRVFQIATETRQWVQAKADRTNYNPQDLCGWCAIAAAELHKRLTSEGIQSEIQMFTDCGCHCYCVVEDHVVDVTATQFKEFKNTPVVILHQKEAIQDYHNGKLVFLTAKELRKHQKETRWPSQQIAYA